MKQIGIFTYSNTVKALKLASSLAFKLSDHSVFSETFELPVKNINNFDEICIIYSSNNRECPSVVIDFTKSVNNGNIPFTIVKLINNSDENLDSSYQIYTNLSNKGYLFKGEIIINDATDIENIVDTIVNNTKSKVFKSSPFRRLINNLKAKRDFDIISKTEKHITKSCSKCYLCIQYCPYDNIINEYGKIVFKDKCANCFKCVYICPEHAIKVSNKKKLNVNHFQYNFSSKYRLTHRQYQDFTINNDLSSIINNHPFLSFSEAYANVNLLYGYLCFTEPFLEEKMENNFIYLHNNNLSEDILQKMIIYYEKQGKSFINFLTNDYQVNIFNNINLKMFEYYELSAPISVINSWSTRDGLQIKKLSKSDYPLLYSYKFIDEYSKGQNYSKRNASRTFDVALEAQMLDYYMIFEDDEGCGIVCVKNYGDKIMFTDFSILDNIQNQHYGSTLLKEAIRSKLNESIKYISLIIRNDSNALPIMKKLGFEIVNKHYFISIPLKKEE